MTAKKEQSNASFVEKVDKTQPNIKPFLVSFFY